jgi:hypothetical protein
MMDVDIRYALFLLPLIYVLLPFILTGSFIVLGGVTVIALISGIIVFVVITNLHIGGSGTVLASGVSGNIGLNNEAGYSLFVVCLGGLFYLGAQLTQFITPILNVVVGIINAILGFISIFGVNTSGLQSSLFSNLGISSASNLGQIYPLNITIDNISVFGALDVIMGSAFILGLYFMVASRGH